MELVVQLVVNGLAHGVVLSLVAVGVALIFGVMRVLNLAHGELVAVGGYLGFLVVGGNGLSLWAAVPLALVAGFGFGWVLQRSVLRDVAGRGGLDSLLLTFGLSMAMIGGLSFIFSTSLRQYRSPISGSTTVLGITLPNQSLVIGGTALLLFALLLALLYRTHLGAGLRAVAQHRDAAAACGVDLRKADAMAFGVGAALAIAGGLLLSVRFTVYPAFGEQWLLQSIIAVVLGGLGSLSGAVMGSLLIGVAFSLIAYWAGTTLVAALTLYVAFLVFILVRGGGMLRTARA